MENVSTTVLIYIFGVLTLQSILLYIILKYSNKKQPLYSKEKINVIEMLCQNAAFVENIESEINQQA